MEKYLIFFAYQCKPYGIDALTEKAEIFTSSLSMSTNPSSELYSEESTEDVADVDSLYQQSAFSNP